MIPPTVHLNGTSKKALLNAVDEALLAFRDAQQKLREVYPNGRDYYPQPSENLGIAARQHCALIEKTHAIMVELAELSQAISEGGFKR